jgi:hypothetical protein
MNSQDNDWGSRVASPEVAEVLLQACPQLYEIVSNIYEIKEFEEILKNAGQRLADFRIRHPITGCCTT